MLRKRSAKLCVSRKLTRPTHIHARVIQVLTYVYRSFVGFSVDKHMHAAQSTHDLRGYYY